MVGVAQSVEHQVVALRVAGSSPVAHPKNKAKIYLQNKTVDHLERFCFFWERISPQRASPSARIPGSKAG